MKRLIWLAILALIPILSSCDGSKKGDPEASSLEELCERLFPERAGAFHFDLITQEEGAKSSSSYKVTTKGGEVYVSGSDPIAMAVGLNRYLSEVCHTYVSPYAQDAVTLPNDLPELPEPLEGHEIVPERFFLNYCTFGYSMPYWKWSDWERLIDWMALQGVTMPLAITGQEKVWLDVWTELGIDPDVIKSYFTGPAHLPWHRMNNIDRWEGPLTDNWLDGQVELQKKILARERSLGMKPVLPAFAGHVPVELKEIYPDAEVLKLGKWVGFDDEYGTYYLSPTSPLFQEIQTAYLEKQTELFGTDHIYGIDAFNEVDAPDWSPHFLSSVAKAIHSSLTHVDQDAKWLMMTWLFYYDREHWTPERVKAFLEAVPKGSLYLLDYYCDKTEVWKETDAFHGQPYLWCYLGNFGGNSWLCGNMRDAREKLDTASSDPATRPMGIGCTLEGIDLNPLVYEYVLSQAWSHRQTVDEWIRVWADRRGNDPETDDIYKAWTILEGSAYRDFSRGGQAVLIHARPCLYKYEGWCTVPDYEYKNEDLLQAWKLLVKAYDPKSIHEREQRYDIVNVGRQLIGNHFLTLRDSFTQAYERRDLEMAEQIGAEMRSMITDYSKLLSYDPSFRIDTWIADAREMAQGDQHLADRYERNARSIITVWGQAGRQLTDYANRAWSGLVDTYYGPRWDAFIDQVIDSIKRGTPFDQDRFREEMVSFEDTWRGSIDPIHESTPSDPITTHAESIIEKYFS